MSLPKDWKEFLQLLNARGAEYVVVGAFALAFHSEPRFTGDLDILIRRTPDIHRSRVVFASTSLPPDVTKTLKICGG